MFYDLDKKITRISLAYLGNSLFLNTVDSRLLKPSREIEKSLSYREFEANNWKQGNKQLDGKERQLSNKV